MILRRLKYDDFEKIDEIWQRCHKGVYGIPARKFVITEAVTENSGKVTGYGLVRYFAEAMLYLDTDLSEYEKAKSFLLLMEQAIVDCKTHDVDQINVGCEDENFAKILERKFGFKRRDQTLNLDLGEKDGK